MEGVGGEFGFAMGKCRQLHSTNIVLTPGGLAEATATAQHHWRNLRGGALLWLIRIKNDEEGPDRTNCSTRSTSISQQT